MECQSFRLMMKNKPICLNKTKKDKYIYGNTFRPVVLLALFQAVAVASKEFAIQTPSRRC